jgi:hypothetical protein
MSIRETKAAKHTSSDGAKISRGVRLSEVQWDFLELRAEKMATELGVPVTVAAVLAKLIREEMQKEEAVQ